MDANVLLGKNSAASIGEAIMKSFKGSDDLVKSEEQTKLEKAIIDGEIKVITAEDIKKSYGNVYYTPENVQNFKKELDDGIEKGEVDHLTAAEFETLEKAQVDFDSLEEVIVKGTHEDKPFTARIFVKEVEVTTED